MYCFPYVVPEVVPGFAKCLKVGARLKCAS